MNKKIKNQVIALRYNSTEDPAPKVTAKGKEEVANKIIAIAKANNIPIEKNFNLVELLDKVDLDQFIPLEAYMVVAEIMSRLNLDTQNKDETNN